MASKQTAEVAAEVVSFRFVISWFHGLVSFSAAAAKGSSVGNSIGLRAAAGVVITRLQNGSSVTHKKSMALNYKLYTIILVSTLIHKS